MISSTDGGWTRDAECIWMLMDWKTRISVTLVVILRLIGVAVRNYSEIRLSERVLPFGACVSAGDLLLGCGVTRVARIQSRRRGSIANDRRRRLRRHLCANAARRQPPVAFGHLCPGVWTCSALTLLIVCECQSLALWRRPLAPLRDQRCIHRLNSTIYYIYSHWAGRTQLCAHRSLNCARMCECPPRVERASN